MSASVYKSTYDIMIIVFNSQLFEGEIRIVTKM